METYIVGSVAIEVDDVKINHYGEIEDWNVSIGGEEIICACDFLSDWVIKELEKKIIEQRDKDAKEMMEP